MQKYFSNKGFQAKYHKCHPKNDVIVLKHHMQGRKYLIILNLNITCELKYSRNLSEKNLNITTFLSLP